MTVTLHTTEIKQAVAEWLTRRGFQFAPDSGRIYLDEMAPSGERFAVTFTVIDPGPKDGPYR